MGRRMYGNTGSPANDNETSVTKPVSKSGVRPWMFIFIVVGIILLVLGIIAIVNSDEIKASFDNNDTSSDASIVYDDAADMAVDFVDSIDEKSSDNMFKYVHPDLKSSGIIADSMNLSDIRSLEEKYDIKMSDITSGEAIAFEEDMTVLENGIKIVYSTELDITSAVIIPVSASISYTVNETDYNSSLVFNVLCMEVGSKWYVYTGDYNEFASKIETVILTPEYSMGSVDMKTESTSEQKAPVVKPKQDLVVYDNMIQDLVDGDFSIDNIAFSMPANRADFFDVISVDEEAIADEYKLLMPGAKYDNLPVKFENKSYSADSFNISIVNTGDISQKLTDKSSDFEVISLYCCRMDDGSDYPQLYLPGNVTFDTLYDDVKEMYGDSLTLCDVHDGIIRHKDCLSIYQVQLSNPNNYLYLQFDSDSELIAMHYYCYDLS